VADVSTATDHPAHDTQRRGTTQLLASRLCYFVFGYVIAVILARKLGAAEYGIYGVVMSQLLWLEMASNAGIQGATAKLIADGRHDMATVERSARAFLVAAAIVLLAVCWFVAPLLAQLMQMPGRAILFRLAVIDLPFAA
jgi:O-antigen/teichoic acid export membrane protein